MRVLAVNSRRWPQDSPGEVLRAALAATENSPRPLELLLENGEFVRSYSLEYREGEKYPRLERIPGKEDSLSGILKSHS
jgi:hypothetical protein